jgi:hypothetical protein
MRVGRESEWLLELSVKSWPVVPKWLLELSVKSWPVGPEFHPSFYASCPLGCCPQSHEIFIKYGYEMLKLGIKCTRVKNILTSKF